MKRKFQIEVSCKVSRTTSVFADDEYDACEQAKSELESDINSYVDDADYEDSEAYNAGNDNGTLWGFTADHLYETDRKYYGATEDLWHRQEYLYHASEVSGVYTLIWREDKEDSTKYCYAIKGSMDDINIDILDKIFGLVECDDAEKYFRTFEYEEYEWSDDDDEMTYCPEGWYDVFGVMPYWLDNEVDDIEPISEWKNAVDIDALRTTLTDKYSNKFIPRVGFDDDFDAIINDAINWGIDNHDAEACTIDESADAFVLERVEYNKMWRKVHALNRGDIILLFHRVKNNDDLAYGWHMIEFYDDNIGCAELNDGMKNQFMFKDAQCVYSNISNGIESCKSISLSDIGEIHILHNSADADRIKTLEYQLEQIKSVIK